MIRVTTTIKFGAVLFAAALLAACSSTKEEAPVPVASGPSSTITPGSAEDFRVNVGDTVFFETDQHSIRPDAQSVLQKQAAWLKQYPQTKLLVEGHADERGTREYNLALGDRRARAVMQYLTSLGVTREGLSASSMGEEMAQGEDESGWRNDRKVTFTER